MIRYESSRGHKIDGVTSKQTGNKHGRRKQNKVNKQVRKQTEENRRESSLQRTSSPEKGLRKEKNKKQNIKKSKMNKGQPHINTCSRARKTSSSADYGSKATI